MQLSEDDEHEDWGIDWHSDLLLHKHSTSVKTAMGSEQLGSSEHCDSQ
jgi:hypothetical protein